MATVLLQLSKCMYCKKRSVLHDGSENISTDDIKYNKNDNRKNTCMCKILITELRY